MTHPVRESLKKELEQYGYHCVSELEDVAVEELDEGEPEERVDSDDNSIKHKAIEKRACGTCGKNLLPYQKSYCCHRCARKGFAKEGLSARVKKGQVKIPAPKEAQPVKGNGRCLVGWVDGPPENNGAELARSLYYIISRYERIIRTSKSFALLGKIINRAFKLKAI